MSNTVRTIARLSTISVLGFCIADCDHFRSRDGGELRHTVVPASAYFRLTNVNRLPLPFVDSADVDSFRGPSIRLDSGALVSVSQGARIELHYSLLWFSCAALRGSSGGSTAMPPDSADHCDRLRVSSMRFVIPFSAGGRTDKLGPVPVWDESHDTVGYYRGFIWNDSAEVELASSKPQKGATEKRDMPTIYHFEHISVPKR